ncbi:MAG: universal stress protein [Bacteroidota bacterium]|nr:universal stress protein [Bacteroidota bacterium]MDP3145669.1 universal stress protein [Bacteroidota bacterium]
MTTSKTILFPTDFSPESMNAITYAIDYAQKSESKLIIINIIEYPGKVLDCVKKQIKKKSFDLLDVEKATKKLLNDIVVQIKKENIIDIDFEVYSGDLLDTLMTRAHNPLVELIILGTKGVTNGFPLFSKTNAYRVADMAPKPVITINTNTNFKEINKILFPINDKLYTTKKLDDVIKICKIYKAEVDLLGVSEKDLEKLEEMSLFMESVFNTLENNDIKTKIHMVLGSDYAEEIDKFSKEHNIDLISIVSNFEHGISSFFKTTPDEKLVENSFIPILNIPIEIDQSNPESQLNYDSSFHRNMKFDINRIIIPL